MYGRGCFWCSNISLGPGALFSQVPPIRGTLRESFANSARVPAHIRLNCKQIAYKTAERSHVSRTWSIHLH